MKRKFLVSSAWASLRRSSAMRLRLFSMISATWSATRPAKVISSGCQARMLAVCSKEMMPAISPSICTGTSSMDSMPWGER